MVAIGAHPDRARFIGDGAHPLAAGLHLHRGESDALRQSAGFAQHRFLDQIETARGALWLLQTADDDDRLDAKDRDSLSMSIPHAVRVDRVGFSSDLRSTAAMRSRVEFITRLCG